MQPLGATVQLWTAGYEIEKQNEKRNNPEPIKLYAISFCNSLFQSIFKKTLISYHFIFSVLSFYPFPVFNHFSTNCADSHVNQSTHQNPLDKHFLRNKQNWLVQMISISLLSFLKVAPLPPFGNLLTEHELF